MVGRSDDFSNWKVSSRLSSTISGRCISRDGKVAGAIVATIGPWYQGSELLRFCQVNRDGDRHAGPCRQGKQYPCAIARPNPLEWNGCDATGVATVCGLPDSLFYLAGTLRWRRLPCRATVTWLESGLAIR